MGKIVVLDQEVSNKIAAGEVIERPASVVKELVENSIDAGSTAITIEIKNGGISFIRVSDNGEGINEDDAVIAFERHATSKIKKAGDLNNISTLGFRGEALASIAAVSQVELITKTLKSITGVLVEVNGGKVIKKEETGCPNGTTIVIKNLFYNTPARLKFLKKESTEGGLISDLIERLSLTHPEISFKLINNNQTILHTTGNGEVLTTILSVFGKDFAKAMIPIDIENNEIRITGFIGRPEISRSNRNFQCVFINNRYIKSRIISSAIESGYKTLMMVNRYPVVVLYLTINPNLVDVNVHPSKMEVRFDNEERIYNFVYEAVSATLRNRILIPQISLNVHEVKKPDLAEVNHSIEKIEDISRIQDEHVNEQKEEYIVKQDIKPDYKFKTSIDQVQEQLFSLNEVEQQQVNIEKSYKIIGQLFSTYILIEMQDKLFIVDQHAAHERLKYKKLLNKYNNGESMSQKLISPIVVNLSYNEFKRIEDNIELFDKIGYEMEPFGDTTFLIRSVPYIFGENYAKEFLIEVIDVLADKKIKNTLDLRENILYSMACKSAVKANDNLSDIEMKQLIEDVLKMEDAFTCPHGRPIIISISKYEIEKMFKRVQ